MDSNTEKTDKDIRKDVKANVQNILWAISAGRCQFSGCNYLLYYHDPTKESGNYAEKAHIRAVSPKGARYCEELSADEKNNLENLMLLCQSCHKTIDDNESSYPVELLYTMKTNHETRIKTITAIDDFHETQMIKFFANIADVSPFCDDKYFRHAVVKNNCIPIIPNSHDLTLGQTVFNDGAQNYYQLEIENLKSKLRNIEPVIKDTSHVSIFALAPQPLLIKLGELLSDIRNVSVYQCHRVDGYKWTWQREQSQIEFITNKYNINTDDKKIALVLSLSAKIVGERITNIINEPISIYEITINSPCRDFVESKSVIKLFIASFRRVMENIKNNHPYCEEILLFPAVPNSLAISIGLDYMPKTDLPVTIYDELNGKFIKTITLGGANGK